MTEKDARINALARAVTDAQILHGWQLGLDTYDNGLRLEVDEHVVANRLPDILAAERTRHRMGRVSV
jgi:hypothetical protein